MSADAPVGVPFNIAQYALLNHMIAQVTNTISKEFIWTGGDVHVYSNQMELLKKQLEIEPINCDPKVVLNKDIKSIDDFKFEDIQIVDYRSHERIDYPVAV